MSNLKTFLLIVSAFFAGSVVSLSTTIALAHGGDTNLNHGCVNNISGALRIVGASTNCVTGETNLDWSKEGLETFGGFTTKQLTGYNSGDRTHVLSYRNFNGANFQGGLLANADLRN